MVEIRLQEKTIKGKKIRTSNSKIEEIIGLWMEVPKMALTGNVYAVYYNYESDHFGEYDFLIGSENYLSQEQVTLHKGNYLKIEIQEATPEKVGEAWQGIWRDEEIYRKRLFTADYEEYLSTGQANIYLAMK